MPIMTSHNPKREVLPGPERRRRWSTAEKLAVIQETYEPDATVSIVARRHGLDHQYRETFQPVGMLGNKTPRQVAAEPVRRSQDHFSQSRRPPE